MLKDSVIKQIKDSNRLKGLICVEMDRSMRAVENWLENDSPMLTTVAVLEILSRELGIGKEELMNEKVHA